MRRIRLRTLLLLINLLILILPLAGIWFLRLYESALIRQTESELVAQAAVIVGAFKSDRQRLIADGKAQPETAADTPAVERPAVVPADRMPELDLATDTVLPPPPDPAPSNKPATSMAGLVGQQLETVIRDTQQVTLASIRVLDPKGVIVASTGRDAGQSIIALDEVARAVRGEPVSVMRYRERPATIVPGGFSRGSALRVFVAMPVVVDDYVVGAVMLSRTPRDLAQAIWGKRYELGALAIILVLVGTGLAMLTSRLITRPLNAVVAQAGRVAAGDLAAADTMPAGGTREAAELSAAVDRMARNLAQRADYIRGFAAHVSHEFKTPLASAKGAVELLAQDGDTMSAAERTHFLGLVADGLDRLERLVRGLVDFARAALVAMPPEALTVALSALLDNALQHAGAGAHVTIETAANTERVLLTITDDGPGISLDNRTRVFEPFFTTARAQGGTGLGLPIVRAVVSAAGGSVDLLDGEVGTRFRLSLPRQREIPAT
jgi:signal transduction histidine kinase